MSPSIPRNFYPTAFYLICAAGIFLPWRVDAREVPVIKFPQLQEMMSRRTDTTYVFNFFATWCQPCKKEFPVFQSWGTANAAAKARVIFVSLDFKSDLASKLGPFLQKRNVSQDVVLLDELDYNSWINQVDPTWSGNLPMTLVINNGLGIRKSFPHDFTAKELQDTLTPFIPHSK
jgi:thiol-disulfide isomerase/thioredoxin